MKLFQYDKKVWDDGDTDYTWQFGIINNKTLLWVHYENPSRLVFSDGGLHILFPFFTNSLFGVDFQVGKVGLSFNFFTEYFDGWSGTTERAQRVKEAFWGNTEYPDDLDECNLANALREVVIEVILKYMQYAEWEIVNKIMEDINELADELEAL